MFVDSQQQPFRSPQPISAHAPVALDVARSLLRGLNREQRRAVTHRAGPALVLAGPGTGKTEVVTRRVAWLIATKRAMPREILALTFTDNAAQEMQARVDVLVPYGQADAAIHTFHAFGDRLLREHAFELGLPSDVRLLSRRELVFLLRDNIFDLGLQRYLPLGEPGRFLGAIVDLFGRAKDEDIRPADLAEHAAELRAAAPRFDDAAARLDLAAARAELAVAFERYAQLLSTKGFIDHSDQVAMALRMLRERPSVRAAIAARYRYLIVDELQDTNRSQLELVLALGSEAASVMAVGDPDQGIYAFRGARTGNIERFGAAMPGLKAIRLRRNYRSLAPIIVSAQRLLASEPGAGTLAREGQQAHRRRRGRPVTHIAYSTPEAEVDGVAAEIDRRIATGCRARDIGVLVRSNGEASEMARALGARGIAVETGARAALLDNRAARALLAFIRVVADPNDSLELFRLAAAEPYQLGGQHLGPLLSGSRRRNRSLWDTCMDVAVHGDERLDERSLAAVRTLVGHVQAAVEMSAEETSGAVIYRYLADSGWLRRAARAADEAGVSEARAVARLCMVISSRASLLREDRIQFLAPLLEVVEPDDDQADQADRDAVSVLTVHRAKGLEFKLVYICGLVDGHFPVRSRPAVLSLPPELLGHAQDDEQVLVEERRLFYVALTRARDEAVLTSHVVGPRGRGRRRPSIFIAEALDLDPSTFASIAQQKEAPDIQALLVPPSQPPGVAASRESLSLSYSQIDDYLTCPERYRLRYEVRLPTPPHHLLSYGTAVHQAIAAFHTAQSSGRPLSEEELADELTRAWRPEGFLSREHEEARFAAGRAALGRFRAQQIDQGRVPSSVERPFTFRLGPDVIRGRIDRIDEEAAGVVITDYKSSDVQDQQRADKRARDSLQLQVYALAQEAETGALPARVQLHFVESGVVGSAAPDPKRLDKARDRLSAAAESIRAESFTPKPSTIACGYCPFRTICTASVARAA